MSEKRSNWTQVKPSEGAGKKRYLTPGDYFLDSTVSSQEDYRMLVVLCLVYIIISKDNHTTRSVAVEKHTQR